MQLENNTSTPRITDRSVRELLAWAVLELGCVRKDRRWINPIFWKLVSSLGALLHAIIWQIRSFKSICSSCYFTAWPQPCSLQEEVKPHKVAISSTAPRHAWLWSLCGSISMVWKCLCWGDTITALLGKEWGRSYALKQEWQGMPLGLSRRDYDVSPCPVSLDEENIAKLKKIKKGKR